MSLDLNNPRTLIYGVGAEAGEVPSMTKNCTGTPKMRDRKCGTNMQGWKMRDWKMGKRHCMEHRVYLCLLSPAGCDH